jgi:diguanylate cyclase (GGDEF)-like protein
VTNNTEKKPMPYGSLEFTKKGEKFSAEELKYLNVVASAFELAMDSIYSREKSDVDHLTGAKTRKKLDEKLEEELGRAGRYSTERDLSVIMMDLDKFKRINDDYDHQQGDTVLKEFANIVLGSIRGVDSFCRYGGEEFTLILPHTTPDQAYELAERIRARTEEHNFTNNKDSENPLKVTVSMGIATYLNSEDSTPKEIILRADTNLIAAKRAGRNQVCQDNAPS